MARPHTIKVNSNMISCPQKICQEINEHFVKIGEKLSANLHDGKGKTYPKFLGKRNLSSIVIQPTDEYKVIQTISSLNNRKSPGSIDIPISLIKEAKFVIAGYLTNSFNECLELGIYPDVLKTAKVIALYVKEDLNLTCKTIGQYQYYSQLTRYLKLF